MHLSIRHRIVLFTVVPIAVIYAVLLVLSITQFERRARRSAERQMSALADHYADQFDGQLREVAQIAISTARFIETNPEMAEWLGVSVDAVKIRLHRARNKLRAALAAGCSLSQDDRGVSVCAPRSESGGESRR